MYLKKQVITGVGQQLG